MKRLTIFLVIFLVLFQITPVFAQAVPDPGPAISPLQTFFEQIAQAFGPQIVTILALAGAQILLAIGVAVKNKQFEFAKLGDFFATIILPKLIGWLACVILARFVIADYLPADLQLIPNGIETVAYGAVVLSFGGAILANLKALEILPAAVGNALTKIGVPDKVKPDGDSALLSDRLNKII